MSIPLPTRSQLLGGIAGVLTWGIVTGLQAYGLAPIATQFVPAALLALQALGLMPAAPMPPGTDPLSFLVAFGVKMLVSNVLIRYWPSAKELDNMVVTLAKAIPQTYSAPRDFPVQAKSGDTVVQDQDSISSGYKNPVSSDEMTHD